ncbi:MAG: NAD(P)H-hydrate dehydratase, partial [Solirubrobacterales bacterium]
PVDEGPGSLVRREPPGLVVDAILGTGFEGEPREPVAAAIEWINRAACPVLACDIPSGVDASTGAAGLAVQADRTVTFHGPKVGQFIRPGKGLTGALEVVPIGFPADAPQGVAAGVITERVLTLLPPRGPESTKFSSGRVSLVGGSRGLTGAVVLASRGAIRAGAGYATAAVPDSLEPVVTAAQAEVMTLACPEGDRAGVLGPEAADTILDHCQGAAAVVLGSGMGRADGTAGLVRQLVETIEAPLVVDADALSLLGDDPGPITSRGYPTIITPHIGEMARLLGREPAAVEAQRLDSALEEAARTGAVVVLKGDDSIVAGSDGVAIDDIESPGLATAGTGDVLAGVCGAFLARGLDPFDAAAAAVFAHARAGRIASGRVGSADGTIASDVVEALPEAIGPLP